MTETAMPSVGDLMREAADLLEQHGWIQGRLRTDAGAHCAIGASMDVITRYDPYKNISMSEWKRISDLSSEALIEVIGTRKIGSWNDEKGRTAEEVIAAIRRAAELVDAQNPA